MYFHYWRSDGFNGIPNGVGIMGIGAGINDKTIRPFASAMEGVDDLSLVIGLDDPDLDLELPGFLSDRLVDLIQRESAILRSIPPTQQIQIGAVDDENPR